jgi:hypothetical protein
MSTFESIPETWDEQRDSAFFRIVCALFPADFVAGAGTLLASYDAVAAPVAESPVSAEPPRVVTLPAQLV